MALIKTNARSASALDATILTGNLPALSGANLTGVSAGKVLQVVSASHASQASTTSSSFQDVSSNLNISITPSATSSKVLVMAHFNECFHSSSYNNQSHYLRVTADGSELHRMHTVYNAAGNGEKMVSQDFIIMHTTNTTSAVAYKLQFRSIHSGETVRINQNSATGGTTITLLEIGA
tara:strand:+ start:95 stop:628 length:534 start_codon:yes stop_codon:yes gene_type:complete